MMPRLDHDYLKYYTPKENDIWVDLGATVGEICMLYKEEILSKSITVVCVEPNPYAFVELTKWCMDNMPNNVILLNTGVWSKNTSETFNITNNIWCNMFDIHGHDVSSVADDVIKIKCPLLTLDSIIDIAGGSVNFLKADIEGAEIEVFCTNDMSRIDNTSIAAYHIVDNQESWNVIQPYFESKNISTIRENIPYNGFPGYTMLYTTKS